MPYEVLPFTLPSRPTSRIEASQPVSPPNREEGITCSFCTSLCSLPLLTLLPPPALHSTSLTSAQKPPTLVIRCTTAPFNSSIRHAAGCFWSRHGQSSSRLRVFLPNLQGSLGLIFLFLHSPMHARVRVDAWMHLFHKFHHLHHPRDMIELCSDTLNAGATVRRLTLRTEI